jgi:streptogramin lyase
VITEFSLASGAAADRLTVGPDGNLWFLDIGHEEIGRITPAGTVAEFNAGLQLVTHLNALTVGPDQNLWFTDQGNMKAIGKVTPAGTITEYPSGALMLPTEIAAGGDGNVWFTDNNAELIGKITPAGVMTTYGTANGLQTNGIPDALTLGPDGNMWFTDAYSGMRKVGMVTPSGQITEFGTGLNTNAEDDITLGADGNLWVEQATPTGTTPGGIARITPAGTITEFTAGESNTSGSDGDMLVTGPDGNIWFNDRGAKAIARVTLDLPPTATTGAASAITQSTATVSGSVAPVGAPTAVTFQYGTTPALGLTMSAGMLTASTTASPVSAGLSGLPAGTTIYYQVVANNGFAAVNGGVKMFKTLSPVVRPPPPPQSITATLENQLITVTTPSLLTCTAKTKTLSATLTSTTIPKSRRAKLRFVRATFYLDRGVKHTRKKTRHLAKGHKKTFTVVTYTANATVQHVPATLALHVAGLRSGSHTMKVVVSYKKAVIRHGHHKTVTVTKTLRVKFRVC